MPELENKKRDVRYLNKTFSDEESAARGIYTFKFTEEDIMRSELVKFIIQKLNNEG